MKYQLKVRLLRLVFFVRLAALGLAALGLLLAGHWIIAILIGLAGLLYIFDHEGTV